MDKSFLDSSRLRYLIFITGYFLFLFPVVIAEFGYSDDISMLISYQGGIENFFFNTHFAWGRPIVGIYEGVMFRLADTFSDFSWIRAVGVFSVAVCGAWLSLFYQKYLSRPQAVAFAVGITLSPAFLVYIGWATCSAHAFSALLALAGGSLLISSPDSSPGLKKLFSACLLLFFAECIYQPTAGFFLFPCLIVATFSGEFNFRCRKWILPILAYLGTIIVYFGFTKGFSWLFFSGTWLAERTTTSFDLISKGEFVLKELLWDTFQVWGGVFSRESGIVLGIGLIALSLLGIIRLVKTTKSFSILLYILALVILGAAPLLASSENTTAHRVLPFLYGVVIHFSLFGLFWWGRAFSRELALLLSYLFALTASACLYLGFVQPYSTEMILTRERLSRQFTSSPTAPVVAVLPLWDQVPGTLLEPSHEFSGASAWTGWGGSAMISLLFRELGLLEGNAVQEVITIGREDAWSDGWLEVIDFREIFGFENSPRPISESKNLVEQSYLGLVQAYPHGWYYSPWLGYFRSWNEALIQHPHLGRTEIRRDNVSLIFNTQRAGNFRVDPEAFPVVRTLEEGRMVRIIFRKDGSMKIVDAG